MWLWSQTELEAKQAKAAWDVLSGHVMTHAG